MIYQQRPIIKVTQSCNAAESTMSDNAATISPEYLGTLASGECRWVLREDIHVYCRAPMILSMTRWGREGWVPGPRTYSVVCPDAGLEHGNWVDAEVAAAQINRIAEGATVVAVEQTGLQAA